jgi:16S rRNA (adenine1518-N6/adenine1519-N6)-dimethyltransferase
MIDLIKSYRAENRGPKKSLGQHFLVDKDALNLIIKYCNIEETDLFLEIGAGCGVLTQILLEKGAAVEAIEIDEKLCDFLERYLFYYSKLSIKNIDFLKYSIENEHVKIVGNLPYNRAASILIHTINYIDKIKHLVLMFQKEVAERITSTPNKKSYGYLSVLIQYYFDIKPIATIRGNCFWPSTKVDSKVLLFIPKKTFIFDKANEKEFFKFVKDCFRLKRKTLRNNLLNYKNIDKLSGYLLNNLNVRAEELSLDDFIYIYNKLNS